jgi:molecular chaperone Hsp33
MGDALLIFETDAGIGVAVCVASEVAREAAGRHKLGAGSGAALGQALAGALLVAGTDGTRVDVQLECAGPLRGFLVDADASGAARGMVRVADLGAGEGRFDPRPLLATGFDERAGVLSILRAEPGSESPHRAVFPFAGANLGAALTFYLRSERAASGGEMALEVLFGEGGPLVAGALLSGDAAALGKQLRKTALHDAMLRAGAAEEISRELAKTFKLGALRLLRELAPRFACRCSRERVAHALKTLGAAELRDMARKDGGASATCEFCAASYHITAEELLQLAERTFTGRPT